MERPHAQAKLLSPTEKCKICNEQAAKHIHYGAMTCFSCRAFFRRSIQNRTAATYACRRNQSCEINLKTRKNCQFCRYQKCILVGMKPTWVLSEEERERRFRRVRERQQDNAGVTPMATDQSDEHSSNSFTEQPEQAVQKMEPMHLVTIQQTHANGSAKVSTHEAVIAPQPPPAVMKTEIEPSSLKSSHIDGYSMDNVQIKEEPSSYMVSTIKATATPKTQPSEKRSAGNPVSVPTTVIVQPAQSQHFSQTVFSDLGSDRNNAKNLLNFHCNNIETAGRNEAELTELTEDIVGIIGSSFIPLPLPSVSQSSPGSSIYSNTDMQQMFLKEQQQPTENPGDYVETLLTNDECNTSSEDEQRELLIIKNEPEIVFTEEDRLHLKNLLDCHNSQYKSVNFGEELIKEMIMCSMFSIPVSTTAAITGYRLSVERVTRIANSLDTFKTLSKFDQSSLLKENADLLVSLRGAIFFDSEKSGVEQVLLSMGNDDLETIRTLFSQLLKEDNMKHISYKTFNSIQAVGQNPMEDRYNFVQEKIGKLMRDDQATVLLTIVLLFSQDFTSLHEYERVKEYQDSYLHLLRRYIYSLYPRKLACSRFAQYLEVLTLIREMAETKKSRSVGLNVRLQN